MSRPPVGVMPRKIHDQTRMSDIIMAMGRYNRAGYKIPEEWVNELNDLNKEILNGNN